MGNEIIFCIVVGLLGIALAVIGMTWPKGAHESRAEVALGLYKYFKKRGT